MPVPGVAAFRRAGRQEGAAPGERDRCARRPLQELAPVEAPSLTGVPHEGEGLLDLAGTVKIVRWSFPSFRPRSAISSGGRRVSSWRSSIRPRSGSSSGASTTTDVAELKEKARAAGFSNYNLPAEHDGPDLPMLAQVAIEEEAGKPTNGLGFIVAERAPRELLELASEDQIDRYVLPVIRHEKQEAWAITEPGAGSDVPGIAATATRDGDEWVLEGEKWFVTGGDKADFFVVLVRAGDEQSLFLVDRGTPGCEIVREPRLHARPLPVQASGDSAHELPRARREPRSLRGCGGRENGSQSSA